MVTIICGLGFLLVAHEESDQALRLAAITDPGTIIVDDSNPLELTTFLFGGLIFFGISYGVRVGAHIGVDVVVRMLSERVARRVCARGRSARDCPDAGDRHRPWPGSLHRV